MKRIVALVCLAMLLLAGCTLKRNGKPADTTADVAARPAENAQTAGGIRAEETADSAWAGRLPRGSAPAELLLRLTKYGEDGAVASWVDYIYNADGFLLREIPYRSDGSRDTDEYVYSYDYEYTNGHLTAKNARDGDDELVYRYKYDADGNEFKWILYHEDGSVRMWYVDEFDERGNVTSHTRYLPGEEPTLMNRREYDYDEAGNILECRFVSQSGALLSRQVYKYTFDGAGRVLGYVLNDVTANEQVEWYGYEYDAAGRLAASIQYDAGGRVNIREEYDYDETGKLLFTRIYSASGALAVTLAYTWR